MTGLVCACNDQHGCSGICKHVVTVNVFLDHMWYSAKDAKRRVKHIRTPKLRCPAKECRSKKFIRYYTCPKYSKSVWTFRRQKDFCLVHIRDIHLHIIFSTNNLYERLNGEFKDSIKTARGCNLKLDKKTDRKLGNRGDS